MYLSTIISPLPPKGFSIELKNSALLINPRKNHIGETAKLRERKLIFVLTTSITDLEKIQELATEIRIAAPPITINEDVLVYPPQKPIIIDKTTTAYYLDPPKIMQNNDYYLYIKTANLEILYTPRPTYITKPPHTDLVLTTQEVIKTAEKHAQTPNEIPRYLGADPQHIIILSNQNKMEDPYIHTKNKKIIITRHLTQTVIRMK